MYIYTHLASLVTYCQLARSSLAHAWHVTWRIGIWISSWYSYSILDSPDSPTQVSSIHNHWWLLDIHWISSKFIVKNLFFVLPWEWVMHSKEISWCTWRSLYICEDPSYMKWWGLSSYTYSWRVVQGFHGSS
jgi:hypothetical protein